MGALCSKEGMKIAGFIIIIFFFWPGWAHTCNEKGARIKRHTRKDWHRTTNTNLPNFLLYCTSVNLRTIVIRLLYGSCDLCVGVSCNNLALIQQGGLLLFSGISRPRNFYYTLAHYHSIACYCLLYKRNQNFTLFVFLLWNIIDMNFMLLGLGDPCFCAITYPLDSKKINVYLRGFPVQESSRVHTLHMPTITVQLAVSFYKKPQSIWNIILTLDFIFYHNFVWQYLLWG